MTSLFALARPLLHTLPPEHAHDLTLMALRWGLGGRYRGPSDPILRQRIFDLDFANPLGLAAGFDKNAEAPDAMLALGFGFVECGTVTPLPQDGNPQPRVFRLEKDRAVINRLGFNNEGLSAVTERLKARAGRGGILGANLGANKDSQDREADYVQGLQTLYPYADYFTINVSSPNTPGLRGLQDRGALESLLAALTECRARMASDGGRRPLLLKVAPDLGPGQAEDIADVALASGIDGLIVSNTTVARPDGLCSPARSQRGGLSGAPLFAPSTRVLARFHQVTNGALPLIGVGGVSSGAEAYAKIRAGARLVQLYTGLIYEGPGLVARILTDLAAQLKRDGFSSIEDAVGTADPRI